MWTADTPFVLRMLAKYSSARDSIYASSPDGSTAGKGMSRTWLSQPAAASWATGHEAEGWLERFRSMVTISLLYMGNRFFLSFRICQQILDLSTRQMLFSPPQ